LTKPAQSKRNRTKTPRSKVTKVLWIACPVILVCVVVWLIVAYGTSSAPPSNPGNSSGPADRVEVVYFHRTRRCYACQYAEEATRSAVETHFSDELDSGRLTFQSVDVQDAKNAAIIGKYSAYSSSLFVNTIKDGSDHIEHVTAIWYLVGNDEAFVSTVKNTIEKSLYGEQ